MADPRFHIRSQPHSLEELAGIAQADLLEKGDPKTVIEDVAPLSAADKGRISFMITSNTNRVF